ncbi:hypothetical protein PSm6_36260 [Pseudomonas solani]|uniref:DUF1294 domain-containing protein n=1 Tax=Pseudomonas solani TaxID=2731552 RepID=A0ABN6BXC2_9PSED|nr:hypothetical protein PSm6_36260 [Pseudomonas solani]
MIRPLARGLPVALLPWLATAEAQVYRCTRADGGVEFTDRGCGTLEPSRSGGLVDGLPSLHSLLDVAPAFIPYGLSLWQLLALVYLAMSLVCFIAYWRDKRFAVAGAQRTPESRLHLYELLGGWPGGLLAQRLIRHKNRKLSYQVKFWLIVALHLGVLGWWLLGH